MGREVSQRTPKCQVTRCVPLDLGDALVFPSKKLGRPKKKIASPGLIEKIFVGFSGQGHPLNAGGLSKGIHQKKNAQKFRDWNYRAIGVTM